MAASGLQNRAVDVAGGWRNQKSYGVGDFVRGRGPHEGVTLFTTEIHPTEGGYDFSELKDMIGWRDQVR